MAKKTRMEVMAPKDFHCDYRDQDPFLLPSGNL